MSIRLCQWELHCNAALAPRDLLWHACYTAPVHPAKHSRPRLSSTEMVRHRFFWGGREVQNLLLHRL